MSRNDRQSCTRELCHAKDLDLGKQRTLMRRLFIILFTISLLIGASAGAANAKPSEPSSPHTATVTKSAHFKGSGKIQFTKAGQSGLQPPLSSCDFGDVEAEATGTYYEGILASINGSWHARVICTTTAPGQSMGGITVNSQLWHNGYQSVTGVPFACTNCNLGNSPGTWADGPTGHGTYWVGATFVLALPAGYVYTAWPTACTPTTNRSALTCVATSGTLYMPPTYSG
jgi:hypothetical protein